MAKYAYDKKALKGLGVGPFLSEVKTRNQEIEKGAATIPESWFNPNEIGKRLHPSLQHVKIADIKEHKDARSITFVPDKEAGTDSLAYFRAGQYVSILIPTKTGWYRRPYTLACSPKDALDGQYVLTIKRTNPGFASWKAMDWKVGDKLEFSGPLGEFYHQDLRDPKHIVAIAGGSGITPFLSMAKAIAQGTEDFNLTILYGSKTEEDILLKEELQDIEKAANGKVQVIHVLSDEEKPGYEHGFINKEIISKYAPIEEDYAIWMCGPKPMYDFVQKEAEALGLPKRWIRKEVGGDYRNVQSHPKFPDQAKDQTYKLKVRIRDKVYEMDARSNESLLWTLERNGIHAPNHCRSGECGWCHSRLISGKVFCPEEIDGRRAGDRKFNWIHTCAAWPISDVEIEVFPEIVNERKN